MSDWDKFLDDVRDAETELGNPKELWYRGQSVESWLLIPSLMREDNWKEIEDQIFDEYKKIASRLFKKRNNDWEYLFDMQHYSIPTRLLDWTTVMGVALSFIMHDDYHSKEDSALFILDPLALNRKIFFDKPKSDKSKDHLSVGKGQYTNIINFPEDSLAKYINANSDIPDLPIAISPSHQNDRIVAQKGVLTAHGLSDEGLDTIAAQYVRKVKLPIEAKEEAGIFLKWANVDEFTLYPDIVGMASYIKRKYNLSK